MSKLCSFREFSFPPGRIKVFFEFRPLTYYCEEYLTDSDLRTVFSISDVFVRARTSEGWSLTLFLSLFLFFIIFRYFLFYFPIYRLSLFLSFFSSYSRRSAAVAQAMAMGLPVISFAHSDIQEVLDESVGYLADLIFTEANKDEKDEEKKEENEEKTEKVSVEDEDGRKEKEEERGEGEEEMSESESESESECKGTIWYD